MSVWPPDTLGPGEYWVWNTDPKRGTLVMGCFDRKAAAECGAESEMFEHDWDEHDIEEYVLEVNVRGCTGVVTQWRVHRKVRREYSAELVTSKVAP